MKRWAWCIGWGLLLAGCQGPATDVGNPNVATPAPMMQPPASAAEELIGSFLVAHIAAASAPSNPTATPAPPMPECQTDPATPPQIVAGTTPDEVIVENFLAYGAGTRQIAAQYNTATKTLSFQVSDATVALKCTGSVGSANGQLTIGLACDLDRPVDHDCELTFTKAE